MKHREKPLLDLRRYSEDAISRDHFVGMKNSEVFPEPPRDWQVYPQQLCPLFQGHTTNLVPIYKGCDFHKKECEGILSNAELCHRPSAEQ